MDKRSKERQSHSNQFISKKIDRTVYVFDRVSSEMQNSFCPARVPIKYGFQIRSLIEQNRLPSWRFSKQDQNQIIYQSVNSVFFKNKKDSSLDT